MWYKNKRCASKSDNRTSAQRICEYGTIRHILPTQHLWKCGWPKSRVTLWHHLCQWDIATKKDKRWISVPITLNINPQNTWERRVVELFFFLYIFRRAKLQMWTIFFLLICGCQGIAASSAPHEIWFCSCFLDTVTKSQVGGMDWIPEVQSPIMFCITLKCGLEEMRDFILQKGQIFTPQPQCARTCTCVPTSNNTNLWRNPKINTKSCRNCVPY